MGELAEISWRRAIDAVPAPQRRATSHSRSVSGATGGTADDLVDEVRRAGDGDLGAARELWLRARPVPHLVPEEVS